MTFTLKGKLDVPPSLLIRRQDRVMNAGFGIGVRSTGPP